MDSFSVGGLVAELKDQDWYCPLPFRHAFVSTDGISMCCQASRSQTTLDRWPNDPSLIDAQQKILGGEIPKDCQSCVQQEKTRGRSLRTDSIRDYEGQRFTKTKIDFIDYRYSNVCNFRCRSCTPYFSHGLAKEVRDNPDLQVFHPVIDEKRITIDDKNVTWILDNLKDIKRLMLTGGEPTLIPEVRTILHEVMRHNLNDMQIMITTNGSFTDDFWYDLTHKLPNLHWTVSVDATGLAAEIVRYGTDWTIVEQNLHWLAINSRSMDINTVISHLNIRHLGAILSLVRRLQIESLSGRHGTAACRHLFFIIQQPYPLAADNLPPALKSDVLTDLQSYLDLDLDDDQRSTVKTLINLLQQSEYSEKLWQKDQTYNQILDQIRGQDHTVLYT